MIMLNQFIYFARESENVKLPTKREEDGCYDIYAYFDEDTLFIEPNTNKLIPTGLYSACAPDYRLSLRERGSNTKWNAQLMAGQIDSGYRGAIFVSIFNPNNYSICISKNTKEIYYDEKCDTLFYPYNKAICQLAVEYVPKVSIMELSLNELKSIPSDRGDGALGSSNK